jgi:hypothetical protein
MHIVITGLPCARPAEPCGRKCRYRLHGKATCALVAATTPRDIVEIAKLMGAPLRVVEMALASATKRWRKGMVAAGVRAPAVKPHSEADERREAYGQLAQVLARTLDMPPAGPGRRLSVEEIRRLYPGAKIARRP